MPNNYHQQPLHLMASKLKSDLLPSGVYCWWSFSKRP